MSTYISTMIYDRTETDVAYATEIKEKIKAKTNTAEEMTWWLTSVKGRYNYTDLNRVSNGLIEAQTLCATIGITITYPYTNKTDYDADDALTTTDIAHILANVTALKTTLATWITTTVPTTIKSITDANNIEYIIYQVDAIIQNIKDVHRYSAELYCGEQY